MKINHMLSHRASINKFQRIKIISNMFSEHNEIKLGLNNRNYPIKQYISKLLMGQRRNDKIRKYFVR